MGDAEQTIQIRGYNIIMNRGENGWGRRECDTLTIHENYGGLCFIIVVNNNNINHVHPILIRESFKPDCVVEARKKMVHAGRW